jgi:hypothetical protein
MMAAKIMFEASGGEKIRGTPYYDSDFYSLDFRPADASASGGASLLVDDVQIEIDVDGRALWIWGLCPHLAWVPRSDVVPPPAKEGVLQALLDQEVTPGVSRRIAEAWPVTASTRNRWLCIGNLGLADTDARDAVEFATDTVAVLSDRRQPREPSMLTANWIAKELLVWLVAALALTLLGWGLAFGLTESSDPPGPTVLATLLFLGPVAFVAMLPGTVIYLLIIAKAVSRWRSPMRQLASTALSPIATAGFAAAFFETIGGLAAAGGLTALFGASVALRNPSPSARLEG